MFFLLLLLFSIWLGSMVGLIFMLLRRSGSQAALKARGSSQSSSGCFFLWPGSWLAINTRQTWAIQSALVLRNPHPCSWLEGLAGEPEIFVTPPIKGWTLVTGTALPEPWEDVDACFRFLMALSRKLGQVQFFSASRVSLHHAWIKVDSGRVVRAYAWAGKTLWNQGHQTEAERELGLRCYGYTDTPEDCSFAQADELRTNVERVPLLAARWGFAPWWIDQHSLEKHQGIVGQLSRGTGATSRPR